MTAAFQRLGQPQQGVQPRMIRSAAFRRRHAFVDLAAAQADVFGAEQGQGFRRRTIAACAADFLIIGLDAFGQIRMGNPADVGLVDAHAKGHRRHHDQPILAGKAGFHDAPVLGLHATVVVTGHVALFAQRGGQRLGLGPCAAIDDAGLPLASGSKAKDLTARAVLGAKGQMDIGPVEAAQEGAWRLRVEQLLNDFFLGFLIGRRGKGRQGHAQRLAQLADAQVIGAEIMAPLADAMRLIHRDQADADTPQHPHRRPRSKPFRRHVQKLQPPRLDRLPDGFGLFLGIARGERTGGDASLLQGTHLITHQGDQRRDHHRDPLPHQGRQLKAQGFAATRRHDGQNVFACGHRIDDLFLAGAEGIKTEDIAQQRGRLWQVCRLRHQRKGLKGVSARIWHTIPQEESGGKRPPS